MPAYGSVPGALSKIQGYDGTNWQNLQVQSSTYPNLKVVPYSSGTTPSISNSSADGRLTSWSGFWSNNWLYGYNGSTWDRLRSEQTGILKVIRSGANGIYANNDISVSTTAQQLLDRSCKEVIIKNIGSNNVRIGSWNVSATRGDQLSPGESRVYSINNPNKLYVMTETGTSIITLMTIE